MESRAVLVESDGIYCKNIEEAFSEVSVMEPDTRSFVMMKGHLLKILRFQLSIVREIRCW